MAAPLSDRTFFLSCLTYLAINAAAVWSLRRLGYDGMGIVGYFNLFLLPAGIFGGAVLGKLINAPLSVRVGITVVLAGLGAAGMPLTHLT